MSRLFLPAALVLIAIGVLALTIAAVVHGMAVFVVWVAEGVWKSILAAFDIRRSG